MIRTAMLLILILGSFFAGALASDVMRCEWRRLRALRRVGRR